MMDTETRGVQFLYDLSPREQFRLGQWAMDDGEIMLTKSYDEMLEVMSIADVLVGHNLFYDLTVMYGKDSIVPLEMALDNRLIDTFVLYPVKFEVPMVYTDKNGKRATTYSQGKQKPELVKRFLGLGNLTNHLGLPGKEGDLVALAKKYNPEGTDTSNLDFGLIPLDDEDFLVYAYNDIVALRALVYWMRDNGGGFTPYDWREMKIAAINNQMSKNGIRLDKEAAQRRIDDLVKRRNENMDWMVKHYDFPTAGKQPWRSNAGKEAILKILAEHGITPETVPDWPKTDTGNISLGGNVLKELTEGTDAYEMAETLASLMGQRSLPELAMRSCWSDGYCHPEITSLQRSGRFSMTNPSLPIWGSRTAELAADKEYFIASPGRKMVSMDFSNADQRIVAAMSGDKAYALRFEPGADGHEISGRLMFGDELYDSDPALYRQIAKALSHAFAYGAGAQTLARTSKLPDTEDPNDPMNPLVLAEKFIDAMNTAYPLNKEWRDMVGAQGKKGWLINPWGRRMPVDKGRSFTQSPGLIGQSGTREILCDGLIRIAEADINVMRWIVATIHDELLWDFPEEELDWVIPFVVGMVETTLDPGTFRSQKIFFPLSTGEPADNWMEAGH